VTFSEEAGSRKGHGLDTVADIEFREEASHWVLIVFSLRKRCAPSSRLVIPVGSSASSSLSHSVRRMSRPGNGRH
jgi:hypothetical protein